MKYDAIYARYSSHVQDDGTSIEVQIEQCERAAGGKCQHYIDRAKTGRAMGGRTQLLALLADAAAAKVRRVFVYKFDRLGRDAETHTIVRDLEENGAEVVSVTEGTNALSRGIQLVVAEDYSRQLASRTRDGLLKRFEQGTFTGGVAPYGYHVIGDNGKRVLAIQPDEAAVVREMAKQYLGEACGFKSIAKRLRERDVASRRGTGWSFTSVKSLLTNPVLTGRIRFNLRRMHLNRDTGRRVHRAKATSEHLERQDEALRILSDATFNEIQERIGKQAKGQAPRANRGIYPFTALVYCQCGAKCYRVVSENKKGRSVYYVCGRHTRYGDCPANGRVREDTLVGMVNERFASVFNHTEEIVARAVEIAREASKGNRQEGERIKAEVRAIEVEQERLVELVMDPSLNGSMKTILNRKAAELEQQRATLQTALDGLRDSANDTTEGLATIVRAVFSRARKSLADIATPAEFNRFVEQFVGPVTVDGAGVVTQKQLPPASAEGSGHQIRCIAGGGFEPPTSGL